MLCLTANRVLLLFSYVNDNKDQVVHSDVSYVPNDAVMIVTNDIYEQDAPCVPSSNAANASLTAELARYKELADMRMILKDRNIKEESLQKELHSVKIQLNSTLNHNKLIQEEVSTLKQNFKQKENKLLEEFLDMKHLKEKVKDKLYKQEQFLQTVCMLCKPKSFYDEVNRVAIGYKNPFYLSKAKQVQPALYNGYEIVKTNHARALVHDSKDTLEIDETTWKQMIEKMKDLECVKKKAKPLKEKAKSAKPITAMTVYPPHTPAKLVPKFLPTKGQVQVKIYSLVQLFVEFNRICKKRITPTGLTEGERGFEQTKTCYLTEVIPFFKTIKEHFEGIQTALVNEIKEMKEVFDQMEAEVDQHAVDKKCNEIERKNLLIENESLIAACLSKDVFYTAIDYVLTVSRFYHIHDAYTAAQKHIVELEAENSNLTQKIQKDDHDEMIKHLSKLEVEHLNLKLKYQHLKEHFGNKNTMTSSDAPAFEAKHSKAEPILDFKALDSQKKDSNAKFIALHDLNERKTKCITMPDTVKPKVLAPGTLREIVEDVRVEKTLDSSLASACLYTKHSQELLEYVIGTCLKDFNNRDRKISTVPLHRKNLVTFVETSETSTKNSHTHVEQQKPKKTNEPIIPSTGVKDATAASGSKHRSNTKKDMTLPAKSDTKKVEDHSSNNKSSVKQKNHVDSSISYKCIKLVKKTLSKRFGELSRLSKSGRQLES
ncbi:hypothetical protein Tco_1372116, partial [Tanacetum coccineum]